MSCSQLLRYHTKLNKSANSHDWAGSIYLPSCSCYSSLTVCSEASNKSSYNFNKHTDINCNNLTNLCEFANDNDTLSKSKCSFLCKKYSLDEDKIQFNSSSTVSKMEKLKAIVDSDHFKTKFNLLKSDINVLSPLCGTKFVFKRKVDYCIKYQVSCHMHFNYDNCGKSQSTCAEIKQRNCVTTKHIQQDHKCPFSINLYVDQQSLQWFIKPSKGNTTHKHHKKIKLDQFAYGKHHLSLKMSKENISNDEPSPETLEYLQKFAITCYVLVLYENFAFVSPIFSRK